MPYLKIETNVSEDKVPGAFLQETCNLLSKILSKPIQYCSVGIVSGMKMNFGGTEAPCAQLYLMSIGKLGVEENKAHAKAIFAHVEKELVIPSTRMYLTFHDAPSSTVGYNGTTFHQIFGS